MVSPHDCVTIIPKLHAANTRACAGVSSGSAIDTSRSHCDTAPGQDMRPSSYDGYVASPILAGSRVLSFFLPHPLEVYP
ncbi:MAG: hypothetical protein PVSMB4_20350 [Ktedonobacterales bacterium]